jgi:hypothetical protein
MFSFPFEVTKPVPIAVLVVTETIDKVVTEGVVPIGALLQLLKSNTNKPDKINPAESSFIPLICFLNYCATKVNKKAPLFIISLSKTFFGKDLR